MLSKALQIVMAQQELEKFLQEQKEFKSKYKGKYLKIDTYHEKRIAELNSIINQ